MDRKKNPGKIFEKDFKASIPSGVYLERYKDDTSGFYGVSNPADFRLYKYPYLFLYELKSHKGKSLPFSVIRENQLKGMMRAVDHNGVFGGYLVNFRDLEETYYLPVQFVHNLYYERERQSIPVEYFREYGFKVDHKKLRTHYRYDIEGLLKRYGGGNSAFKD